jgi:hypothetical protein
MSAFPQTAHCVTKWFAINITEVYNTYFKHLLLWCKLHFSKHSNKIECAMLQVVITL